MAKDIFAAQTPVKGSESVSSHGRETVPVSEAIHTVTWKSKRLLLLFLAVAVVYILVAAGQYLSHAPGARYYPHFIYLADGWLHGHLYLHSLPPSTDDYTFYQGHWYVAFPPLPAVLLLPFVAILHLAHQNLLSLFFSVGLEIVNIGLLIEVLMRFARLRKTSLTFPTVAWLVIFFAFGTETFFVSMQGSVWFQAHVVAITFLLLYIGETLGKRRPWLAGLFLGLASLARSTTLFTFPFFLVMTVVLERKRPLAMLRQVIVFGLTLGLILAVMLLYNQVRFGSFFDFGYAAMNVNSGVRADLAAYGQFNVHFLGTNLFYMWVQLPILVRKFPFVTFTPYGTGIFWTTPALLCAFLAFRQREQRWLAFALLAGCLLPLVWLLLYFNTGWVQFGNRFSLDYLPLALLLAVLGMRARPGWPEKLLIGLSLLLNIWGYIVFIYFPFAISAGFLK